MADSIEGGPAARQWRHAVENDSGSEISDTSSAHSVVDSLDLSASLPYWLALLRSCAMEYVEDMDRQLYAMLYDCKSGKAKYAPFTVALTQMDVACHAMFQYSAKCIPMGGAAALSQLSSRCDFVSQINALAADWERRARTFHPGVFAAQAHPLRKMQLPALTLPSFSTASWDTGDVSRWMRALQTLPTEFSEQIWHLSETTALWSGEMHRRLEQFPETRAHWWGDMRRRLELFRESVSSTALEPLWAPSRQLAHEAQALPARIAALEYPGSDLVLRFEETLETVSSRSRARAADLVQRANTAVHEVEETLYRAALQLANGGRELIHYQKLPTVWRNNDLILTGYRFIPLDNWSRLLRSIFEIHNETGNIHTHLGGLVLIALLFWFTAALDPLTTPVDRAIQTVYLIAAAKCLVCSVSWHVMMGCADKAWFQCFACIDYTGISWLVAASLLTLVYNGFYCQPFLAGLYALGAFALGLTMAILPWAPWFDDPKNRSVRISLFIFMALMGLVPFTHGALLHGVRPMAAFFQPVVPSLLSYVVGVFVYALRLPERFAPGRFDIVGHSHQLWHVAIVLAIGFHYRAIMKFHEHRFGYSCATRVGAPETHMLAAHLPGQVWGALSHGTTAFFSGAQNTLVRAPGALVEAAKQAFLMIQFGQDRGSMR
ncbi:inc metabolism membrane protein [Malassezia sp. CBS 17886]|nr:inc metabolism membrane protein [Malassezia sp. CBS 17886]